MRSLTPITSLLLSAFAVNPITAVPTNAHSLASKFLEAREPVTLPGAPSIGDVFLLRDNQLFRKRGLDDNSTTIEAFAIDARSGAELHFGPHPKRTRTSLNDYLPGRLFRRAEPEGWDELESYKCGDTRVMIDEDTGPIGGGGSGQVYKGVTKEGKNVAMKGSQDSKELDKEFDIVSNAIGKHDHIIEVYGRCTVEIMPYLMMELLEGGDLQKRVDAKLYVGQEALVKLVMAQIFDAVEYFNGKGVAHQDLKPANVMFGAGDVVKVIDFGMATKDKTVSEINVAGGIRSPEAELRTTMEIDPIMNDQWELGVIMVSMLLGKKPWTDAGAANAKAIWSKPNPSLRSQACKKEWPDFTTDFCDVLGKVFAPQLDRKPLSVFRTAIANPNLKLLDDCNKDKDKKTGTKRSAEPGELFVVAVDDEKDEWVVRAVAY